MAVTDRNNAVEFVDNLALNDGMDRWNNVPYMTSCMTIMAPIDVSYGKQMCPKDGRT